MTYSKDVEKEWQDSWGTYIYLHCRISFIYYDVGICQYQTILTDYETRPVAGGNVLPCKKIYPTSQLARISRLFQYNRKNNTMTYSIVKYIICSTFIFIYILSSSLISCKMNCIFKRRVTYFVFNCAIIHSLPPIIDDLDAHYGRCGYLHHVRYEVVSISIRTVGRW